MIRIKSFATATFFIVTLQFSDVYAWDLLPYTKRTKSYSAWTAATTGDIRTVGMAGATVGLADTFIAALDNPAGLSMTLDGADSNFASATVYDGYVQNFNYPTKNYNFGVALNQNPWAFSIGYVIPSELGQNYQLQNANNDEVSLLVKTYEFHLSVSRNFFENKLSLGGSLIVGQGQTEIDFLNNSALNQSYFAYALGASAGMSVQLPRRVLFGLSYSTPMHYTANPSPNAAPQFPGFFQTIQVPGRLGMGFGWIPNRFLRGDLTTFLVQSTQSTALLSSDSKAIGEDMTLQPRIGFAYIFLDYSKIKGTLFMGTYYEVSRIQGEYNRWHGTTGVELKSWVITAGTGLDRAAQYRNFILSIGVDIFKVMEKLDIIPSQWQPKHQGAFPDPLHQSEVGLPRTLVKNWEPEVKPIDALKVGLDIPDKIEEKAIVLKDSVKEILNPEERPKSKDKTKDAASTKSDKKNRKKNKNTKRKTVNKKTPPKANDKPEEKANEKPRLKASDLSP